jgi:DNA-binding SARP family transcriptional activator
VAIQFQILGPLRVTDGDEREIALGGAKPAAVLAMLVLRAGEVVSPDRLIDDLWDGQPPPTAAKTLQVHISRLRRAFGAAGPIATARGGYVLDVEPEQIDARRFEALVADGTAALAEGAHARASARLRAALALWRGDALADFAYASFAQDDIARFDGLRTVALESACEAELALGRHTELIPELKGLVKNHPLSEHLQAQLMLALYRSGRQAEALGVYRAARRVLVDQLGLEPSEELRELERAILAQDRELAAPSPRLRPVREQAQASQRAALVGYERELTALEDLLEQALGGQGRLALISGEPGIGKTRLADELGAVAGARGAQVVWGRCWSGGGAPAYWPWIQVLRALTGARDPATLRAELGPSASELTQLLPELRDLLPAASISSPSDPEEARFRLFDAVAGFVARAAGARPLVIVLDDLHSADAATLSMLQFMAGAVLDAPVLIVGTYRDTEAALERLLSDTLSELARTTDCLQLVLTGLSGEDTAHFVEVSAGVAPMPTLAAAIHDASSGNPLFVSELVRLLDAEDRLHELEAGDSLAMPRGLSQVIVRRLEQLSEPCRRTLSLAAVIGRDFDMTLLADAAAEDADSLLAQIDDALAARVIERVPGGAFRFSHDLVRQTLYAGLGAVERRHMHEAVARALEEVHATRPEPVLADLAHHFSEALPGGDAGKATRYLGLAGDQAAELSAYHEAAALYGRAAEIGKAGAADAAELRDLYLKLAEQYVAILELEPARAAVGEADALLALEPDPIVEGRLAIARAHFSMLDTSTMDEEAIFSAIDLFEANGDPLAAARGWSVLVTLNCGRSDRLQGNEASERMLECARRGGSKALTGQAMRNLGSTLALGAAPVSTAVARLRALLHEAEDPFTRARLTNCVAELEGIRGRFDEGRALIAEARAIAPQGERLTLEGYLWSCGARLELRAGNPRRAEELARRACADLESQGLARYLSSELLSLVDALIEQERYDEARTYLDRAIGYTAPDDVDALLRQARSQARLELAHGNLAAAEDFARQAVEYGEAAETPDEHSECLLLLATVLFARDRLAEARHLAAEGLRVAEARENVPVAQRARRMLGVREPVAAGASV